LASALPRPRAPDRTDRCGVFARQALAHADIGVASCAASIVVLSMLRLIAQRCERTALHRSQSRVLGSWRAESREAEPRIGPFRAHRRTATDPRAAAMAKAQYAQALRSKATVPRPHDDRTVADRAALGPQADRPEKLRARTDPHRAGRHRLWGRQPESRETPIRRQFRRAAGRSAVQSEPRGSPAGHPPI